MDFVARHRQVDADITIACLPMDDTRAADFGLMKIDSTGKITEFAEKPKGDELKAMQVDTTILGLSAEEAAESPYIASMGIYVFKKEAMLNLLGYRMPDANDFGSEVIPAAAKEGLHVHAYLFNGYWEDIGTMKSFYDANLALTEVPAKFEFYDATRPIYTSPRFLPPSNLYGSDISNSIISHGVVAIDSTIKHSVIGLRSRLEAGCTLEDTLMIGADYYQTNEERIAFEAKGEVPMGVGEGTFIKGAILDKNARIGKNCSITNKEGVAESAREDDGYFIRSGILTVLRNATIANGTVI